MKLFEQRRADCSPLFIGAFSWGFGPMWSAIWGVRQRSWSLAIAPAAVSGALVAILIGADDFPRGKKYTLQFVGGAVAFVISRDLKRKQILSTSTKTNTSEEHQRIEYVTVEVVEDSASRTNDGQSSQPSTGHENQKTANKSSGINFKPLLSILAVLVGIALSRTVRYAFQNFQTDAAKPPVKTENNDRPSRSAEIEKGINQTQKDSGSSLTQAPVNDLKNSKPYWENVRPIVAYSPWSWDISKDCQKASRKLEIESQYLVGKNSKFLSANMTQNSWRSIYATLTDYGRHASSWPPKSVMPQTRLKTGELLPSCAAAFMNGSNIRNCTVSEIGSIPWTQSEKVFIHKVAAYERVGCGFES